MFIFHRSIIFLGYSRKWSGLDLMNFPPKKYTFSVQIFLKHAWKWLESSPLQVPCRVLNSISVFFSRLQYTWINFCNIFNPVQTFNILANKHLKLFQFCRFGILNSLNTLSTLYASAYAIPASKKHPSANTKFECVFRRLQVELNVKGKRKGYPKDIKFLTMSLEIN